MNENWSEGKRIYEYEEENEDNNEKKKKMSDNYNNKKGSSKVLTTPCCQVDNCNADLSDAKQYHKRHKVCEQHSKDHSVLISHLQQRFCQQCSRFHEISEFDELKRSCRRRLAGHNQRRRKSASEYQSEGFH